MTKGQKKNTWVARYGSPETRIKVEHDDGDCPACVVVGGGLGRGDVVFVEVEVGEGSTELRRVEDLGGLLGVSALSCRIVSREDADLEIAEHPASGARAKAGSRNSYGPGDAARDLFRIGRMILDPGYMAYESARIGARLGEVYSRHDPCARCGHGRLLHKRQAYAIPEQRARDEALPETRCRGGRGGEPECECPAWEGVETPVPSFDEIVGRK